MNDQLRAAAQAVLDRWDSPKWEWATQGPTADLMAELRAALAQQAEPTGKDSLPVESVVAENATTQQQIEQTPPSDYRRGYWAGFAIGKREGRIEAEDEPAQQAEPSSIRELLTQAAAMAVAAERAGKYEGASWVADAVLEAAPQPQQAEPAQEPFALQCPTPKACREHCCQGDCIPRTAPPQRKPEPMALDWLHKWANQDDGEPETQWHEGYEAARRVVQIHLTTPPPRKPLTDAEIPALAEQVLKLSVYYDVWALLGTDGLVALVRAVEQAHGIKESP